MLAIGTGMNLAVGKFRRKSPLQDQFRIRAVAVFGNTWALSSVLSFLPSFRREVSFHLHLNAQVCPFLKWLLISSVGVNMTSSVMVNLLDSSFKISRIRFSLFTSRSTQRSALSLPHHAQACNLPYKLLHKPIPFDCFSRSPFLPDCYYQTLCLCID